MIFIYLLLGAVALVVIVLFSVQNAAPVTVWFYNWKFDASLAIVVFLSAVAGMVVEAFVIASLRVRRGMKRRSAKKIEKAVPTKEPPKEGAPNGFAS